MTERDQLRAQLKAAGDKLAAADDLRAVAIAEVKAALQAAHGSVPLKEAAELANVSRPTAYKLLEQ